MDSARIASLYTAWRAYSDALADLFAELGAPHANVNPAGEFSEQLVAAIIGGEVTTRNNPSYDVVGPAGELVQVKSLMNTSGATNPNWLVVEKELPPTATHFAVVTFTDRRLDGLVIMPRAALAPAFDELTKLYYQPRGGQMPGQLQITRDTARVIYGHREVFESLGMLIWTPSQQP